MNKIIDIINFIKKDSINKEIYRLLRKSFKQGDSDGETITKLASYIAENVTFKKCGTRYCSSYMIKHSSNIDGAPGTEKFNESCIRLMFRIRQDMIHEYVKFYINVVKPYFIQEIQKKRKKNEEYKKSVSEILEFMENTSDGQQLFLILKESFAKGDDDETVLTNIRIWSGEDLMDNARKMDTTSKRNLKYLNFYRDVLKRYFMEEIEREGDLSKIDTEFKQQDTELNKEDTELKQKDTELKQGGGDPLKTKFLEIEEMFKSQQDKLKKTKKILEGKGGRKTKNKRRKTKNKRRKTT